MLLCIFCRLEKRVSRLKREIQELRNTSQHSFSSTPTSAQSYTSDRGSFMDPAHLQVFNELLKVLHVSCSYSSQMQVQKLYHYLVLHLFHLYMKTTNLTFSLTDIKSLLCMLCFCCMV